MGLFAKKNKEDKTLSSKQDKSSNFIDLAKSKTPVAANSGPFRNPEILDVNLIQEETDRYFDWNQNIAKLLFFAFLAVFLVIEVYIALSWIETKQLSQSDFFAQDFQKLNNEIREARTEAVEAQQFKDKLSLVESILDRHVYWTNFFSFLENNTLDSVYYSGFAGNIVGKYQLAANAKTFENISEQVSALRTNSNVSNITVSQGSLIDSSSAKTNKGAIQFILNLDVSQDLFRQ
jgi:hypothetical protein